MTKYNTLIAHMKSYIISSDYKILENQSTGTMKVSLFTSEEYIRGMCENVNQNLFVINFLIYHYLKINDLKKED